MMPPDFNSVLSHCELCPRMCGVNRLAGEHGFCRAGNELEIYRYAPHHGEEPPISGRKGSGTVFFSRCTLKCLYCQNYPWSQEGAGKKITVEKLAAILRELRDEGCHNWNLVSPTHWLPMIYSALESVKKDGKMLPVVYNTSGYERVETIEKYGGKIVSEKNLGKIRLAYPIKNENEAVYYFFKIESPAGLFEKVEKKFKMEDSLWRYLLIKV